jgi:hypothetical protein
MVPRVFALCVQSQCVQRKHELGGVGMGSPTSARILPPLPLLSVQTRWVHGALNADRPDSRGSGRSRFNDQFSVILITSRPKVPLRLAQADKVVLGRQFRMKNP